MWKIIFTKLKTLKEPCPISQTFICFLVETISQTLYYNYKKKSHVGTINCINDINGIWVVTNII
jgi:hypothetical protein